MQTAIVKYQIGSYSGKLNVIVDRDDSDDSVITKAQEQLYREAGTDLPQGYVVFTIIKRIDDN